MAIMWEPPAERLALFPTPAELAWKRWLVQALIAANDEAPTTGESMVELLEQMTPAA